MPEDSEQKKPDDLIRGGSDSDPILPPVVPPSTRTPYQINQQINIQQIPPRAWEKLSAEQTVELTKAVLTQVDKTDERQFNWAMEQAKSSAKTQRVAMAIGGLIAVSGVAATTYLAIQGHQMVAAMLGTFLGTIIAVTIGNRMYQ